MSDHRRGDETNASTPGGRRCTGTLPRRTERGWSGPVWRAVLLALAAALLPSVAQGQTPLYVPDVPPRASLITVSTPSDTGDVTINGASGSVPGSTRLAIFTLETGHVVLAQATPTGSFSAVLFAPAGTSILVKSDPVGVLVGQLEQDLATQTQPFVRVSALPGTIIRVPEPLATGAPVPFAGASRTIANGEGLSPLPAYIWQGTVSSLAVAPGQTLSVQGTLTITSPVLENAGAMELRASLTLERLTGPDGAGMLARSVLASSFATPTGLPVERLPRFFNGPLDRFLATPVVKASADRGVATVNMTLTVAADLPHGLYRVLLQTQFTGMPMESPPGRPVVFPDNQRFVHGIYGPIVRIGNPAPPRLFWTLLADTGSNGVRGVGAAEDRGRFALATRTGTPADTLVIPRVDPRSGQPISYRLEPFVPMVSLARSDLPNAPLIPFRFPSGTLVARVQAPDGTERVIGPAPFVQSRAKTPGRPDGRRFDDGPFPADVYELSTMDDRFEVQFSQEGRHVVTLDGSIEDIWGNVWAGGGTYEVHVARTLAMDTAVLPGTPFEIGDSLNAGLQLSPAVPADVEVRVRIAPGSDPGQMTERVVRGLANPYGHFHPPAGHIPLDQPGEYRVDVTASYRDEQGALWMGTRTWGGVIAPRNSDVIAHGRRGDERDTQIGSQWFFRSDAEPHPLPNGGQLFFPFHSGDVQWASAQDGAFPIVTFQNPGGPLADMLRQRIVAPEGFSLVPLIGAGNSKPGVFDSRVVVGEVPLVSARPDQIDPHFDPSRVDIWAYSYRSVQRPQIRVREEISEDGIQGVYWFFNNEYQRQIGVGPVGDLPNDFKLIYGAAVLRGPALGAPRYAVYGSMWVHLPLTEGIERSRVFPPFQGNGGGPSGGPIMRLLGRDIDLFIHLTGVRPGTVLEVGDVFALSGAVAPALPGLVSTTITKPDGSQLQYSGHANKVGYYYRPDHDVLVDQPGIWTVDVTVVYDGTTSAGQITAPLPTGDVLGTAGGRFTVYVVPRNSLLVVTDLPRTAFLSGAPVVDVRGSLAGAIAERAHATAVMPGFVLASRELPVVGNAFSHRHDPVALSHDFPNLDVPGVNATAPADLITLTVFAQGRAPDGAPVYGARVIALHGDELLNLDVEAPASLVASVLPASRSVRTGVPATVFATMVNAGTKIAAAADIGLAAGIPATFTFQTTDPVTNQVTGSPNSRVDIRGGHAQTYVLSITPSGPFDPTDVPFTFAASNAPAVPVLTGINTLLLSASTGPVPDVMALAATIGGDGIVTVGQASGAGAFAVATVNLGDGADIAVSADTGGHELPITLSLCQTNPVSGECTSPIAPLVVTRIDPGATPTFGIFVTASAPISFDPASNRIFVRFKDAGGIIRGATSVAVRMQ